ncbi:MAG: geranylgeranyl reductase family protein [Actinobacteria bacterium]|nr:MAG: geranylgeranyl reductase family protein [Actinomycetota bacterium]
MEEPRAIIDAMNEQYDAIIVGAGPGGSATACSLVARGFRVLMVDKETFPREKICGDGIAPRAVHSLYHLGLREELAGRFKRTAGIRFYATHGGLTEVRYPMGSHFPDHGYVVPRRELDAILLARAEALGAEVMQGCRVTGLLPEKGGRIPGVVAECGGEAMELAGRFIIGADGPSSLVGKEMGLLSDNPLYMGVSVRCYMSGVKGVSDFLEIYPEDAITPSCGWIFPVDEKTANVGVGFMLYAREKRKINLNRVFDDFAQRTRHAAAKLREAKPLCKLRGAMLRVGMGGATSRRANVLLVGDAASLTNPISGEGITYALESGRWAGETVAAALHGGDDSLLDIYPRILEWKYRRYFYLGTLAIRYFNNPYTVNPLLFTTSRIPRLGDKMGRFLMNCRRSDYPQ